MRKAVSVFLALSCILVSAGAAFAAKVAITSVGQSPDGMMVRVLTKKLGVETDYDAMMKSVSLGADLEVLIAVVGGSSKGLGAAGIDKEEESARAVALVEAARQKNVKILVMHVGGEGRRGELTDLFVRAVAPLGDRLIVVKSGNADNIFGTLKAPDAALIEAENIQAAAAPLGEALKEWGAVK
ncbi:MAG: DUF6305 family protein [Synergistaceae bacterium]|jgi:hypothetical protein|nr:DUF6305 family protein [Synergistaceae bacterium]